MPLAWEAVAESVMIRTCPTASARAPRSDQRVERMLHSFTHSRTAPVNPAEAPVARTTDIVIGFLSG